MTSGKQAKNPTKAATTAQKAGSDDFPIVGIGASAGGLEAFGSFFSKLPKNTGMAFVLVQHLDPTHVSNMVELLKRFTTMTVLEARDGLRLQPDHVYMIPPNYEMTVSGRTLKLVAQAEHPGISHSIDQFFRSLAADLKDRAISVILSGTGSDGTLGAKAVKAEMGMVMVQEPETARYDGMPRSAIIAGVADIVTPVEQMGNKLVDYVQSLFGKPAERSLETEKKTKERLQKIFGIIRARTRRDFSQYKISTINRRIERRMNVNQLSRMEDYIRLLQTDPREVDALVKDFLISVTSFFRDPDAFEALKPVLKELIRKKGEGGSVRAWIPGCATGEEAYSIAIIIEECRDELGIYPEWDVFGTDLDADAIAFARAGLYPETIKQEISPARLEKYFTPRDGRYQVNPQIRGNLVFAVQDVVVDPPFSRLDLIVARNILIYFSADLQKRIMPLFNYSLNDEAILFLGTAESVGSFTDLFSPLDNKWKIYQNHKLNDGQLPRLTAVPASTGGRPRVLQEANPIKLDAARLEKTILRAMPPSVVVDRNLRILYVSGTADRYLQVPEGEPTSDLLEAARPELRAALSGSISKALVENAEVIKKGIKFKQNGITTGVTLRVKPVDTEGAGRVVIVFDSAIEYREERGEKKAKGSTGDLEQELNSTRESLRSTIEELETANEELRSANEEYQSTNEELSSANEELETSREELQSVNEELITVNNEHQAKIEELSVFNDDMKNLLNSTKIATLFIDNDARIKRYTPAATEILNLIEGDIGRPVAHVTSILIGFDLAAAVKKVLNTLVPVSQDGKTTDGKWYSIRVHPYRTTENSIAGAVVSFLDISGQKKLETDLNSILDTLRESIVILDGGLNVISANGRFYQTFKTDDKATLGKSIFQIDQRQWDIPELRKLFEEILKKGSKFDDFKVDHEFPVIGRREMLLNARKIQDVPGEAPQILLAIDDVTKESIEPQKENISSGGQREGG